MSADPAITAEDLVFTAADGTPLAGRLFAPPEPTAGLLVSSATGFPMTSYWRFAEASAKRGFATLAYDYRGIGASKPQSLRGSPITYLDWGRQDMPAALRALEARVGDAPILHVGHSVGGHFIGFMDNHDRIAAHGFVCVGTGYFGKHHLDQAVLGLVFWAFYGPVCLSLFDHIPAGGLWGGEALPRGVYETWRRWCVKPRYFLDELHDRLKPHYFEAVRAPITSWIFTDDGIANPRTGADLLTAYPNAPRELRVRRPQDYGLKRVSHGGAFKRASAPFWPEVWETLETAL
ncbi:MAG: alpha/beta fold hydrolase [Maricaulaceae bacterium]